MKTLEIAVVGSGPAGLYTAEALIKQSAALERPQPIRVDVLDRLPTPYGLVRYGVAPAYLNIAGKWQDHIMYQLVNAGQA